MFHMFQRYAGCHCEFPDSWRGRKTWKGPYFLLDYWSYFLIFNLRLLFVLSSNISLLTWFGWAGIEVRSASCRFENFGWGYWSKCCQTKGWEYGLQYSEWGWWWAKRCGGTKEWWTCTHGTGMTLSCGFWTVWYVSLLYTYLHACMHTYIHIYIYVYYICLHVCMYMDMCVCAWARVSSSNGHFVAPP